MARYLYRDARTGQYVTKDYAKRNESTVIREKVGIVKRIVRAVRG